MTLGDVPVQKRPASQRKKRMQSRAVQNEGINLLKEVVKNEISLTRDANQWTKIRCAVDSGATDPVMPISMCNHVPVVPSAQSERGVEYEVANGEIVPNLGERRMEAVAPSLRGPKHLVVQVCDVHKALLSVASLVKNGHKVVFGESNYIENIRAGEVIPMERNGNLYEVELWVR